MTTTTVAEPLSVGVFDDLQKAEKTIEELRHHGFHDEEIGIIGHVGQERDTMPTPLGMKAPEWNATRGVSAGGVYGAIIGAMVALVVPGLGAVTELGRWFEIAFGTALGAILGGVLLAFGSLFFSRLQGRYYESELARGRFIVTVKNPLRQEEALAVLRRQAVETVRDRAG